jgi:hypothetical protein
MVGEDPVGAMTGHHPGDMQMTIPRRGGGESGAEPS